MVDQGKKAIITKSKKKKRRYLKSKIKFVKKEKPGF